MEEDPDLSHLTTQDFEHVYEPSDDTWLMMDALKADREYLWKRFELGSEEKSLNPMPVCVEIGSGSGALITYISKLLSSPRLSTSDAGNTRQLSQHCLSYAVDINPHACQATRSTMQQNHVRGDVVRCNLLSGVRLSLQKGVDVLIFNPPYVPTPIEELTHSKDDIARSWAGGERGRVIIDELIQCIGEAISSRGVVYFVLLAANDIEEVNQMMEKFGMESCVLQNKRRGIEHLYVIRYSRPV